MFCPNHCSPFQSEEGATRISLPVPRWRSENIGNFVTLVNERDNGAFPKIQSVSSFVARERRWSYTSTDDRKVRDGTARQALGGEFGWNCPYCPCPWVARVFASNTPRYPAFNRSGPAHSRQGTAGASFPFCAAAFQR